MFRKILVPLDGSELAEQALPYARRLAGTLGRLLLVRASSDDASAADVEDYLDGLANRLQQDGAAAEWHLYCGPAAEAIGQEASLQRADTVVMSTHGRSGVQRLMFGSVAEQVLHDAEMPVLLVPARTHTSWHPGMGQQVIIPLDGSPLAEAALDPAVILAGRLRAGLLLLGVVEPLALMSMGYQAFVPGQFQATEEEVA